MTRRFALMIPLLWFSIGCGGSPDQDATLSAAPLINSMGVTYVDAPFADYRVSADEKQAEVIFQRWFDDRMDAQIEQHGWKLFSTITKPSGQYLALNAQGGRSVVDEPGPGRVSIPTWDTWFGETEVFDPTKVVPGTMQLHPPGQAGGAEVTTFNKYNRAFLEFVHDKKYNDVRTLIALNEKFQADDTPLIERFIDPPPLEGIMLKPTYWAVKKGQVTPLSYWKGPGLTIDGTTSPKKPTDVTWKQIVLVNDTGKPVALDPVKFSVTTETGGEEQLSLTPLRAVTPDDFYAIPLSAEDIAWIQKPGAVFQFGGISPDDLEVGDLALLVGMHITSVEWSKWTWQTVWWSPLEPGKGKPGIVSPWLNYDMALAYYYDKADGSPHIAFNPHLEPPITGPIFQNPTQFGAHSNCMSCHHAAAFPTVNKDPNPANMLLGSYIATGPISGTEQFFKDRTKTHFMWGLVLGTQSQAAYADSVAGR